jgi:undecaprenyl-diphosphatase
LPQVVRRLNLGRAEVVAAVGALVVLFGSLAVFGGVSEDVTQRNGLARQDFAHLHFFTQRRTSLLVHLAKVISMLGALPVLALIAALAGVVLWRRGVCIALAVSPALSLVFAGSAAALVKAIVGRARPPVSLHLVAESDASFPSGHSTDSAALYLTLALVVALFVFRRTLARALSIGIAGALVAAIGASRLVLGVHWPTDVLAGWSLGMSTAVVVTLVVAMVGRPTPGRHAPARGLVQRVSARIADVGRRRRTLDPPGQLRAA